MEVSRLGLFGVDLCILAVLVPAETGLLSVRLMVT